MYYTIQHITKFRYSAPISESIMEVRIQPRSEGYQHCLNFRLHTNPRAHILSYRGELGNKVQHFDVPNSHSQLVITAEAAVELFPGPPIPQALSSDDWGEIDTMTSTDEYWDMLMPSHFAHPSELLLDLATELHVERRDDPLTVLRHLNSALFHSIEYSSQNTTVDSPIDDALRQRRGVCQDFAHIMTTLVRGLGIPCRYVSGYLYQRINSEDRSSDGATHAWVEALLPELGWVGFDPTNDVIANDRHIRVAIGRDYADVPPTRGVFRGSAKSELAVSVKVGLSDAPPLIDDEPIASDWQTPAYMEGIDPEQGQHQQQPQQQ
jgi:transglutaminase-like putative cysteine protease